MASRTPKERALAALTRPNARLKFRELKNITKLTHNHEVEAVISELRKEGHQIVYYKVDSTFLLSRIPTPYSDIFDLTTLPKEGSIGLITDTHLCSVAERLDLCERAYDHFVREGVGCVLHVGDVMDGWDVYRGHSQFVKVVGALRQAAYCIKHYPRREGLVTYAISGNHDNKSYLVSGVDQLSAVVNGFDLEGKHYGGRDDIVYLGQYSRYLVLPQEITVHLLHPTGGFAYARSYKQQRRAWAWDKNTQPDIELSGHYHTFNYTVERESEMLQLPGLQDETEFFKRLGYPRDLGVCVMRYAIRDAKLTSFAVERFNEQRLLH